MLNKVQIIGRLGKDVELRYTQSGTPIATMNIATDESFADKDGTKQDRTEWHRVVAFQRQAETCNQYLAKGSLVYVEGKLTTRKWQDQSGQDRYTTEIKAERVQFLDRKSDGQGQGQSKGNRQQQQSRRDDYDDLGPNFPSEASGMDDVPFSLEG